jgi:hypothetical protein
MNMEKNMKGEWIWRGVISLLLGVVGWYAARTADEQKQFNRQVNERVSALEMESARTSGNRFTSMDWVAAKSAIDATVNSHDKRITRMEDAVLSIKETLPRIEKKLDDLSGQ